MGHCVVMGLPFPKQALVFTCLQYKSFENTVGKGEIAHKQAISPFATVFSTLLKTFLPFSSNLKLSSAISFSLEGSKICHLGKVNFRTVKISLTIHTAYRALDSLPNRTLNSKHVNSLPHNPNF